MTLNKKEGCAKAELPFDILHSPLAVDPEALIICSDQSFTELFSGESAVLWVILNTKQISEYETKFSKLNKYVTMMILLWFPVQTFFQVI